MLNRYGSSYKYAAIIYVEDFNFANGKLISSWKCTRAAKRNSRSARICWRRQSGTNYEKG